jgi:hypothetical protein
MWVLQNGDRNKTHKTVHHHTHRSITRQHLVSFFKEKKKTGPAWCGEYLEQNNVFKFYIITVDDKQRAQGEYNYKNKMNFTTVPKYCRK